MSLEVKFIYFDLAGVQYNFKKGITSLVKKNGLSYEDFAEKIAPIEDKVNKGLISVEMLIQKYNELLGLRLENEQQYLDTWTDLFAPIVFVHRQIYKISEKYEVGIITNIHEGMLDTLFRKKIVASASYKTIIQSFQIGSVKPDKKIYLLAQEKANVLPKEILFIDDNKEYIKAAEKLGWNCIWFDSSFQKSKFISLINNYL